MVDKRPVRFYIEIGIEDEHGRQQRVFLRKVADEKEASTPHKVLENLLAKSAEDVVKKQLPPGMAETKQNPK